MTTNPERLSDEALGLFLSRASAYKISSPDWGRMESALRELRELRALLSTPMPCGWPAPFVTSPNAAGEVGVAAEWLGDDVNPDEAIALGAALVRAGRAARGGR